MATISNVNGKKITKIKYKGEIFDTGGGGSEGDVNPLQHIIDNHKGDGQPSGEDLFYEYWGSSLDNVIPYCDFSGITSAKQMFYDCKNLTSVPLFNTSNVTGMQNMFWNCINLTTIPQLDTSKVKEMFQMFYSCINLTTIPQLDTSSATSTEGMFSRCSNLTTTPQLNTSKVTKMNSMFSNCPKLTTIDITHMNFTSTSSTAYFAAYCYSLTKVIIRNMPTIPVLHSDAFNSCYHFNGTVNATYNPQGLKDGRIYVPDDKVDALKTATNWSVYADIIVPLSTLVE